MGKIKMGCGQSNIKNMPSMEISRKNSTKFGFGFGFGSATVSFQDLLEECSRTASLVSGSSAVKLARESRVPTVLFYDDCRRTSSASGDSIWSICSDQVTPETYDAIDKQRRSSLGSFPETDVDEFLEFINDY